VIKDLKFEIAKRVKDIEQVSLGIGQVKIKTAMEVDEKLEGKKHTQYKYIDKLKKPFKNINYVARYLQILHAQYKKDGRQKILTPSTDDWIKIISMYNTGYKPEFIYDEDYDGRVKKAINYYYKTMR